LIIVFYYLIFDKNCDDLNKIEIDEVKRFLRFHLRPLYLHFCRGDEYLSFRVPKRGSSDYSRFYIKPRFKEIKRKVDKLLRVVKKGDDWGFTNAIFLTYTFDCDVLSSWFIVKIFSKLWDRVKKRLERRGYRVEYGIRVVEAQKTGKAHLHILLILNDLFTYRVDLSKGRGFIKSQGDYDELREIFDLGLGFFDIQAVYSKSQAVGYLAKYISKNGEGLDDLIDTDRELSNSELKRLLGLYFLVVMRLRFFSVFGSCRKLDKGFKYSNNLDADRGWVRLQGEGLRVWVDYLERLGLEDLPGLGIRCVRGSPGGVMTIAF
jgi:hypothetical protein